MAESNSITSRSSLLIVVVALVLSRIPHSAAHRYSSTLTFTDPSMTMISTMVERGDLWGASARAESSYRLDQPGGLMALGCFSILVLRRGLDEYDGYERCYARGAAHGAAVGAVGGAITGDASKGAAAGAAMGGLAGGMRRRDQRLRQNQQQQ
jgi:hypothetical protein